MSVFSKALFSAGWGMVVSSRLSRGIPLLPLSDRYTHAVNFADCLSISHHPVSTGQMMHHTHTHHWTRLLLIWIYTCFRQTNKYFSQ